MRAPLQRSSGRRVDRVSNQTRFKVKKKVTFDLKPHMICSSPRLQSENLWKVGMKKSEKSRSESYLPSTSKAISTNGKVVVHEKKFSKAFPVYKKFAKLGLKKRRDPSPFPVSLASIFRPFQAGSSVNTSASCGRQTCNESCNRLVEKLANIGITDSCMDTMDTSVIHGHHNFSLTVPNDVSKSSASGKGDVINDLKMDDSVEKRDFIDRGRLNKRKLH